MAVLFLSPFLVTIFISVAVNTISIDHFGRNDKSSNEIFLERSICSNEALIYSIQKLQFKLAKDHIFERFVDDAFKNRFLTNNSIESEETLQFFSHHFDAIEVEIGDISTKPYDVLVYYRVYKNANNNIRTLLYNLEMNKQNHFRKPRFYPCPKNLCSHPQIKLIRTANLKYLSYFTYEHMRFPFIFVRDPLLRFISAVTEVEYRIQNGSIQDRDKLNTFLTSPWGSQERFQEFIHFLLFSGGSLNYLRNHSNAEIDHIAPQVGSLWLGRTVESQHSPLRLFRFEQFDDELRRLAEESGVKQLFNLYSKFGHKDLSPHVTTGDPLKTTLAAKSFLSYASVDAFNALYGAQVNQSDLEEGTSNWRLGIPEGVELTAYQEKAKSYLIAICRIYFCDYVCADYALPNDCQFLIEEAVGIVKEIQEKEREREKGGRSWWMELLRRKVLPAWGMNLLSSLYCLYDRSPECVASFLYGIPTDRDSFQEEL